MIDDRGRRFGRHRRRRADRDERRRLDVSAPGLELTLVLQRFCHLLRAQASAAGEVGFAVEEVGFAVETVASARHPAVDRGRTAA